jgi:hypothetical protein
MASFLGLLVHFLTALLIIRTLELLSVSRRESLTSGFLFAFATFGLPHATDGYEHSYEALGIAISICCLVGLSTAEDKSSIRCASAGLAIGFAVLFRNSALVAVPGLLVLGLSWRQRAWFLLGLAPSILLISFYNYARFQSPFETGYEQAWLTANPEMAQNSFFTVSHIPAHLFGLWFSFGKGMLLYSPVLLLLAPMVAIGRERLRLVVAMMTIVGLYSLFYAANFGWHGSEWCWGPRYLIPTLVPIILLIGVSWATPDEPTESRVSTGTSFILTTTRLRRFNPTIEVFPPTRARNHASLSKRQPPYATCVRRAIRKLLVVTSVGIQVLAISVSYQRHLTTVLVSNPSAFMKGQVLYNLRYSPLFGQITALRAVLSQMLLRRRSDLDLFIPEGPWRNLARTASNERMLSQSIDLNTLHLWWIRACYFPLSLKVRAIACLLGLTSLTLGLQLLHRTWRKASSAATG